MKIEKAITVVGIIMFSLGLVLFYSIESGQSDQNLRFVKNMGTFIGLSGMGATIAGILSHLLNRNKVPLEGNLDI